MRGRSASALRKIPAASNALERWAVLWIQLTSAPSAVSLLRSSNLNFTRRTSPPRRAHFVTFETWLATHCHFPLGIFTHVSVQRLLISVVFPEASVCLPLLPPVAMAALP